MGEVMCDRCGKFGDSVFAWNGHDELCWVCLRQMEEACKEELMKQW